MLVVGGGYIGMELGSVYANLGSKVVVVEALSGILSGADPDLVRPVLQAAQKSFRELRFNTKVTQMATKGEQNPRRDPGRRQSGEGGILRPRPGLRRPGAPLPRSGPGKHQSRAGRARLHQSQSTNRKPADPAILAIGDIAGGVLLAHKASKEARVAVETILGEPSTSAGVIIPAVVFTDPELAWCGLTEAEARAKGLAVEVAKFPWGASGRALTFDHAVRPDQTDC